MNKSGFVCVGLVCALTTACGDSSNPAGPTSASAKASSTTITSVPSPVTTVAGIVQNITISSALVGTHAIDAAPLRVVVVGTSLATEVNTSGQFLLEGVPAGLADLSFQGPGVDAPLRLGILQPGQRVEILVTVNGSIASVDRNNGRAADDQRNRNVEVEGALARLNGKCPVVTFLMRTITIRTNIVTNIDRGCSALRNGVTIDVTGNRQGDGSILATRIEREDDDEDDGNEGSDRRR